MSALVVSGRPDRFVAVNGVVSFSIGFLTESGDRYL